VDFHVIDPLSDNRWDTLAACHPKATVFHQRGWLGALARTYGYQPFVVTSTAAGKPLSDGIVLCRISSWVTGNRAVSLPFSDHCEPLVNDIAALVEFTNWLQKECDRQRWKYVELRPLSGEGGPGGSLGNSRSYWFHSLDLTPNLEQIYRGLHKDSIQRRIRRAEREGLSYETGRSEQLVDEFYDVLLITRRRHQLLPQPRAWFRNLVECMGDNLQIRLARKAGRPIAAMLCVRHRGSVVYKYGCSNDKFHSLAAMPMLFWRLIEESKASGIDKIDFGRSDMDNPGLMTFKDRFGTTKKLLTYFRYPQKKNWKPASWSLQAVRQMFALLPDAVLPTVGQLVYRHMG
jgi:hypothetical protein